MSRHQKIRYTPPHFSIRCCAIISYGVAVKCYIAEGSSTLCGINYTPPGKCFLADFVCCWLKKWFYLLKDGNLSRCISVIQYFWMFIFFHVVISGKDNSLIKRCSFNCKFIKILVNHKAFIAFFLISKIGWYSILINFCFAEMTLNKIQHLIINNLRK